MSRLDYACALGVVLIWGVNFAVMKFALQNITPMLLGALRYALASLPLLYFVRMPRVPMRFVLAYGLVQGVGQFGFLFVAISLGMAAGVASLVLQTQAMLTLVLAAVFLGERTRGVQWLGVLLATGGLGLIAASHGEGPGEMT
ncbi:MAG: O-acetylserine/cysteine exporter, partial [Comamonadaceae bacterium]